MIDGSAAAARVDGREVPLSEVMRGAKWRGETAFIRAAVEARVLRAYADEAGISVDDDTLQEAADAWRRDRDLLKGGQLAAWLAERSLTVDDWQEMLEADLLRGLVREHVARPRLGAYFAERRAILDSATLSWILSASEDVARELRAQVVEEGADFHALARRFSEDAATRPAGGYAGRLWRFQMEPAIQPAVFGAGPGGVAGPVKTDDGWLILLVEEVTRASLTEEVAGMLKDQLFREWLGERIAGSGIEVPLLEV